MKNLQAIKVGNVVNVSHKGAFYKKVFETEAESMSFFKEVIKLRENYNPETFDNEFNRLMDIRKLTTLGYGLEYDVNTKKYYLNGINVPIPKQLENIIYEYHKENLPFEPIINFWNLLLLNPNHEVRESLFNYLSHYQLMINDDGYFVGYKAVRKITKYIYNTVPLKTLLSENNIRTIKETYEKIKRWKKSPKNFVAYFDGTPKELLIKDISKANVGNNLLIGNNLEELYNVCLNVGNLSVSELTTKYTDKHTGTMDIVIGKPVREPLEVCDKNPKNECSKGLHVGSPSYVKSFANSKDEILICLVNPMNVVAVPNYDTSKLRSSEYIPMGIAEFVNGELKTVDGSYYEERYLTHEKESIEHLIEKLKEEHKLKKTSRNDVGYDDLLKLYEQRLVKISNLSIN